MGLEGEIHGDGVSHFLQHGELIKGKKLKRVRHLIWCAVNWNL